MRLLILGGTAFLGRALARQAVARGWEVTCAARGTGAVPAGANLLRVDRARAHGLTPLVGQHWEAVIDVTRQPGQARRATRSLLADHWVFISSASVYSDGHVLEPAEDAATVAPLASDELTEGSQYAAAKVACEQAVMGTRATWTIIRAGLIGGDGDWSGRTGYYAWRFAHPTGDDVLVPPDQTFPVAVIDVEDLASWTLHCAERRVEGVYNATGPTTTLGAFLEVSRAAAGATAALTPVPTPALAEAGVGAWMGTPSLPLWLDDPAARYTATLDTGAARREGLRTRPLAETVAATLAYENQREEPRACGLTDDEERRLRTLVGRFRTG